MFLTSAFTDRVPPCEIRPGALAPAPSTVRTFDRGDPSAATPAVPRHPTAQASSICRAWTYLADCCPIYKAFSLSSFLQRGTGINRHITVLNTTDSRAGNRSRDHGAHDTCQRFGFALAENSA